VDSTIRLGIFTELADMPLSIRPIGTNKAFSLKGFNTNYIVAGSDGKFLFDCGATAPIALDKLGISITEFQHVYLSHLHLDHVGGLIQLGLTRFNSGLDKVHLYCHEELASKIWPKFLESFMGRALGRDGVPERFTAEDFFEIHPLLTAGDFPQTTISGVNCSLVRSEHPAMSDCYGLVINDKVYITSDTVFRPEVLESVANHFPLEAIFHHCTYNDALAGMHATVTQLRSLPEDLRQLIILSHYDDHMLGKTDPVFEIAEAGKIYSYS